MACIRFPGGVLTVGGDVYEISVYGTLCAFEWHPYLGPMPVTPRRHDPIDKPIRGFWDAVERWKLGGEKVENGRCVVPLWCVACKGSGIQSYKEPDDRRTFARACPYCEGNKLEPATG